MGDVRINVWKVGPRGGRTKVASQICHRDFIDENVRLWEASGHVVTIQDGNIRPQV